MKIDKKRQSTFSFYIHVYMWYVFMYGSATELMISMLSVAFGVSYRFQR